MISKAIFLLNAAKRNGIHISLNKGELQLKLSKGHAIDPQLLQELKEHKEQIIEFLNDNKLKSTRTNVAEHPLTKYDRNATQHARLSFSQERLWFIHQLEGTSQYHLPTVLRLQGELDQLALAKALQTVVQRHEVLRSVIYEWNEEAYQRIADADSWELTTVDGFACKSDNEGLLNYIRQLIRQPFDLQQDYMLRATLIRLDKAESVLVVTMHHIASDGSSLPVIVQEVVELYRSAMEGRASNLKPLELQYADYAVWQRNFLQGTVLENKIAYWKDKLSDLTPLDLPTDFPRPLVQSTKGASANFGIDKELTGQIQQLCLQQGTTLFMALLAAFKVLLYRYSGQADICVGTPIAGRQHEEVEGLVGFFVNTLALRTLVEGDVPFTDLLADVKVTTMDAYEHQEAPFEKIVEAVVKERDLSRSPLFQVMFALQNIPGTPELVLPGLTLSGIALENKTAKFDLSIYITETANGLHCSLEYCTELFGLATIERLIDHYKNLVSAIVKSPNQPVGLLPMIGTVEQGQIIEMTTGRQASYPAGKNLLDFFEEQVSATPGSAALIDEHQELRYDELDKRANQLANYLLQQGVKSGTILPVCIERSLELVIAVIAVLKAGCAYTPIDTSYPAERISYMLEDTGAELLITSKAFASGFANKNNIRLVAVDDDLIVAAASTKPTTTIQPGQAACIIYTSGSSGKPKGVQLGHAGILNRLHWMWETYPFEAGEVNAIKTSPGFVDHIWELFGALNKGIPSVIFNQETLLDLDLLISKLAEEKITRWVLVPSLLRALLIKLQEDDRSLPGLRYWTSSGEALPADLVADFFTIFPAASHRLLNIYGSSEVTADVSVYETRPECLDGKRTHGQVPIGQPISNTAIYLLDKWKQLVPIGVTGEIYVSGIQVAQGYFGQSELTAQRFSIDSFSKIAGTPMFRTGDQGRLLPDGNIIYLGRIDEQVKIRGNRVEPGEVETVLRQTGLVGDCAVIAYRDSSGNNSLVGYLVGDRKINDLHLSELLKQQLPDYMVPTTWIQLDSLPLTTSGKINRKALPDPGGHVSVTIPYIPPATDLEKKLVASWQQLLKKERIGIQDNFFTLGGHSLLAMRVVSALRKEAGLELAIKDIFLHPTIASLTEHLQQKQRLVLQPSLALQQRPDRVPLSFSQERLWFIDRLEGSIQYHLPVVLRMKGQLNTEALRFAIQTIINRHEVLRTVILEEDGLACQVVQDAAEWQMPVENVTDGDNDLQSTIRQLVNKPFDLSKDYMLRAGLLVISELEHLLVVTVHHIASDGWSMSVLVKEVMELYAAKNEQREPMLKPLSVQYADYAIWQRNYLQGDVLNDKISYWKQQLDGVEPLQLPADFPRPAIKSNAGARAGFLINTALLSQLQQFSKQQDATLFMSLLTAFKLLLYRYSGQEDICVGTPTANRTTHEVEQLIGYFVNTLALRTEINDQLSFTALLQQVRKATLEAYEHQDTPFEKVVDAVVTERDLSRTPVFQVLFVLQNTPDVPQFRLGELVLSRDSFENKVSKFDITLTITETSKGLVAAFDYSTALFKEATILAMIGHFKTLLQVAVNSPDQQVGLLPMLSNTEEQQLLVDFNESSVVNPADKTIIDLFQEQATLHANEIALVFEEIQLSYSELNERSNKLARYLRSKGVNNETLVPLCFYRGADMIVSLLAILKAGAAYVPIDPGYPEDRIAFMLEDTAASIVLTNKESSDGLKPPASVSMIEIDRDWSLINLYPGESLETIARPDNLAYVIYTSGSTGKPKGVMIEHSALLDHCFGVIKSADLETCSSFALFAPLVFDAGHSIIHACFILGASLHVLSRERLEDGEKLAAYIHDRSIDCVKIVPSLWLSYADTNHIVLARKRMIFGGDSFSVNVLDRLSRLDYKGKVFNHYGPTEATIGKTIHEVDLQKAYTNIPIGKPFSNTAVYITNALLQLVPVGVPGELYIAGEGLARGYLNNKALTDEKFIANPFSLEGNAKMYKTGDQARWLPDGNIEYLGRIDEQVKIRGFRIEPGEIENVLKEAGLVQQAVVLPRAAASGNKVLVAYIVPVGNFDKDKLVSLLRDKLPEYMIPAFWVPLLQVPLTSNGKINRKALPVPDMGALAGELYIAPFTPLEQALANIWQELLGVEKVGTKDNFFELGGDSIITIQVVSRARHQGYDFQVADIFKYQTIEKLAAIIEQSKGAAILNINEQGLLTGEAGLLPVQQRYFAKEHTAISHFNQAILLQLDKQVDEASLAEAIRQLSLHHDALRFRFFQQDGEWQQQYGDKEVELVAVAVTETEESLAVAISSKASVYQRSLDIENGELMRAVLFKTDPTATHNRLLIIIHHLVVDGVSWRILVEDLELLLTGLINGKAVNLGSKTSSYRQWYQALEAFGQSKRFLPQPVYWEKIASQYQPLPSDTGYRGTVKARSRGVIINRLNAEHTRHLLQDASKLYQTDINDLLLAALYLTIKEWSGQQEVIIGLEGHGRQDIASDIDTSRTIGWFSNHYPLLLAIKPGKDSLDDCIKSVKENLRQVPFKGLGHGICRYIRKDTSLQGTEPWDIVFNYLGQLDHVLANGQWLKAATEPAGNAVDEDYLVSEKMAVNGSIKGGELILNWTYSREHYNESTITSLASAYLEHLAAIIDYCASQQAAGIQRVTPADFGLSDTVAYDELDKFLDEPYGNTNRRQNIAAIYPLSALQQGVLFHSLYEKGTNTYVQQFACDLVGADINIFTQSWNKVLQNHSILRTAFYHDRFSIPLQCVYRQVELPVALLDFRDMDEASRLAAVAKFENTNRGQPFDYTTAPLMRLTLIQLTDSRYRMIWTWSHILFDGWSMPILMEEFLSTYESLLSGGVMMQLSEDRYEDYIRYIDELDKEAEENYWRNYFKGLEQNTLLPFITTNQQRTKGTGTYQSAVLRFDDETGAALQKYVQSNHLTLNTIMQGVWACLLHQYTGNQNIVFGVVVSGRPDDLQQVERRVGLYINAAPLHADLNGNRLVTDWLQNLQLEQVASRLHQYTSLNDIQSWTGLQGDMFDTLLVFENYPVSKVVADRPWSLQVEKVRVLEQTNYPLTVIITSSGEQVSVQFSYNAGLLPETYVHAIRSHFEHVLRQVISGPSLKLHNIKVLTAAEEQQLLTKFNPPKIDYTINSIAAMFEAQVHKTPAAIAVLFEDLSMSYQQLNEKSNQLAHYLLAHGVQPGALIPVCIERGINMMVAILGIIKSGAAYVPIDPEYPEGRIRYMLDDTAANLVITSSECRSRLQALPGTTVIEIDKIADEIDRQSIQNPTAAIDPGQLAYIIYTSGSTGQPKGVLVEHKGVVNLAHSQRDALQVSTGFRILQFASFGFDASCYEIFVAFLNGGTLVIPSKEVLLSATAFEEMVNRYQVGIAGLPPSYLHLVKDHFGSLHTILSVGEAMNDTIGRYIQGKGIRLINGYGPTENTVCVSLAFEPILPDHTVVIGRPTANVQVYILDNNLKLCPIGTSGEIHVSGPQVARGYLNRPELTAQKFVPNPFAEESGTIMYKTGDLGRWLPDGNLEYMGRVDEQVKIRGFRIEPGEIETVLMQSGLVEQVVVVPKQDNQGHQRLVAYVVGDADQLDQQAISAWLHDRLPEYMVPSAWVILKELPLTVNGKVDKRALPDPGTLGISAYEYQAPVTEIEIKLAAIYAELLGLKKVGTRDNFFELGGHSLLAMRAVSAIRKEWSIELPIKTFFELITIERVANFIKITQDNFPVQFEDYEEIKF